MVRMCVIEGCPSGRKSKTKIKDTSHSLSFFQPTTSTRLKNWTKSLGIELKATDNICHLHFKETHIKMYDEIKIGNVVNIVYLGKKLLKEEALPTIKHQFYSELQPQNQTCLTAKQQEKAPHHNYSEEQQQQHVENNHFEQQQKNAEQQAFDNTIDLQEKTLSEVQQQSTHDITEQDQQQIQIELNGQNQETQPFLKPIDYFKNNINKVSILPAYWFFLEKPKELEFMRIDPISKQIKNHIRLNEDLSITAICSNNEEVNVEDKITSLDNIYQHLKSVEKWPICVGTQIERKKFSKDCKGVIIGEEAYKRNQMNPRCKSCRILRNQLQTRNSTFCSESEKSLAYKRRAKSIVKQRKRLKLMKMRLRDKIIQAKSECASKCTLVLEKAIKDLPAEYQTVVSSCFEAAKRSNAKGRRYTLEWVYECMLIRLKNRNTYEFLRHRNILPLPSLETLNRFIRKISCSAYGFQPTTFACLKERCEKMDEKNKRGVILVDEMKLSENIYFDSQSMKFNGFVDLGQYTPDNLKNKAADHALVFKFVPFRGRWVQVLGCFLSRNACTSVPLHKLMFDCIVLMENSGIHVDTVVTDGATWNRGVWKILGISEENTSCEHPCDSERRLWMLSDFNHLTKCFRNGIINEKLEEFETPYGIVKKKHWEAVIEEENYKQPNLKIAHKLSPAHLNPKGYQKMNVPLANQLFGHEVSVAMAHYEPVCEQLKDSSPTQKLINLMYNLIQAMSSRIPLDALYTHENCRQRQAILAFLEFIEDWEKFGKTPISKSTLVGLKVTLRGTLEILSMLKNDCRYTYLMTATLSQDPLERFFSVMRFSCGGNDHPDPKMFGQVYRLISSFSLIRPPKGCNVVGTELMKTMIQAKDALKTSNASDKESWLQRLDTILEDGLPSNKNFASEDDHNYNEAVTNSSVQSYIAGYIGRKMKKLLKCDDCSKTLEMKRNDGKLLDRNDVVNKMELYGGLFYASTELFKLTEELEKCVLKAVSKALVNLETIYQITEEITKIDLQMVGCSAHTKELTKKIIDFYIVMRAHFLAKFENKRYEAAKIKTKMHRKNAKLL